MRILVVDDDGLAGEMTSAVLEELGHDPVLVESASQAHASLASDPAIELLISDLNMPVTNGLELFRQLRISGVTLPFILLTGDDPERARREEPGLDGCVLKDFPLEESLAQAIAQIKTRRTL
jgi:CheY-like chemotaxis protein